MFERHGVRGGQAIKPSFRNELEITDAIQYLIDRKYDVRSHVITGWWKDTGKLEDMLEARPIILSGIDKRIEGEVSADTRVEGPVIVGRAPRSAARCCAADHHRQELPDPRRLRGAFTSVADEVEIVDSEIEHSIILDGSRISGLRRRLSRA